MTSAEERRTATHRMRDLTQKFAVAADDGFLRRRHSPFVFVDEVAEHLTQQRAVEYVA